MCQSKLKSTIIFTELQIMVFLVLKGFNFDRCGSNAHRGEAPRLITFTNKDNIAEAFIADEIIRVSIPDPKTCTSVSGLLAAYYVWHREFPSAYQGILDYITHEVYETPLKNNSTVAK
ncbi:uncharacterized protein LOC112906735 [Agrilus planipennis]|uniref:Uncharacterized protein LOC112906735 n=1 Tax=Agrilus planipennis TaxID=224129 RepID=A0A7F5RN63_AGRPL|nr:uncharacterized protein LOC112906735 [Agrilus planipennis]